MHMRARAKHLFIYKINLQNMLTRTTRVHVDNILLNSFFFYQRERIGYNYHNICEVEEGIAIAYHCDYDADCHT